MATVFTRIKKRVVLLTVFSMVFAMVPATAFGAGVTDISGHWAENAIQKWVGQGIITGHEDGTFKPDAPITRGEMAVIISKVFKYQSAAENKFSDLDQSFYTAPILQAAAAGVISGDGATVRPKDNITRQEAAVVICKAFALESAPKAVTFLDSNAVAAWAAGSVGALAKAGYIRGSEGKFNPASNITRAEVVTILNAIVAGFYSEAGEYTGKVNGTVVVNASGVILKDMEITGDLIIAQGVGSGEVTLDSVTVSGRTLVWGGGENSIYITGNSSLGTLIISKTDDGGVRIVTSDGVEIEAVYVDDGKDDVILTGEFNNVVISGEVPVHAVGATIEKLEINAKSDVTLDKDTKVGRVVATENAQGASIEVSGTVTTLSAQAPVSVDNKGTISNAEVKADGIILDGSKPGKITVDSGVEPPKDSSGNVVEIGGGSGGGGGGGGTGGTGGGGDDDSGPYADAGIIKAPLADGPGGGIVNYASYSVTGYTNGQINIYAQDVPKHKNGLNQDGHWVGAAIEIPVGVTNLANAKYYFGTSSFVDTWSGNLAESERYTENGKDYVAFYADAGAATPKTHIAIDWDREGATYTAKKYQLNLDGVQWTTITPTVVTPLPNVPPRHKNEGKYEVSLSGNTLNINVTGALENYDAGPSGQESGEWLAILINTGETLTGVEYKTTGSYAAFSAADIQEAQGVGADGDQTFVWWVKAETADGRTIALIKNSAFPETAARTLTIDLQYTLGADDLAGLRTALASGAATVKLDANIEVPAGDNLEIPAGKTLNIPADKTLTLTGDATLTVNGTLENLGTIDAASFYSIGGMGPNGSINSYEGSAILIQDEADKNLIGAAGLDITSGKIAITFNPPCGALFTLPEDSAATVSGPFMDASHLAYRLGKFDKLVVEGELTVDYDMKVTGDLVIAAGGELTVNSGKTLSLLSASTAPETYYGVLTNNGNITNNGVIYISEYSEFIGDGTIDGSGVITHEDI